MAIITSDVSICNKKYVVSVADSRFSKQWKPSSITWEEFKALQKTPKKDNTTQAAYEGKSKSEKVAFKDAGGYVAGSMIQGQRKKDAFGNRAFITLDADNVKDAEAFLFDLDMALGDVAYCVFSTRSHKPDIGRFRYRVVLPMDVLITDPEMYSAASRKCAELIGIKYFDSSTFQHTRLMFNSSISSDQDFFWEEGSSDKAINVHALLSMYADWKDRSSWACITPDEAIKHQQKNAEDPTKKVGAIGLFCRTWSIHDVLDEILTEEYSAGDSVDKYTYVGASTSNGAIVYDNLWIYSFHESDPAKGQLLNAFDLVRIHKFADLDADAKDNTPSNKLPSYLAMVDYVNADERCKVEGAAEVMHEFEEVKEMMKGERIPPNEVIPLLDEDKRGIIANEKNYGVIVNRDNQIPDMYFDLFCESLKVREGNASRFFNENVDGPKLRRHIGAIYGIRNNNMLDDAMVDALPQIHPVRELLKDLVWDGVERVENILIEVFNCEPNNYHRAVIRKFMIAACKRIHEPGCKFDNLLMLIGGQAVGKSSFVAKLAIEQDWRADMPKDITSKDALQLLHAGYWILEFAEGVGISRGEQAATKGMISATDDTYRASYARRTSKRKRQNVFVATTNEETPLQDITGNRRYWTVKCSRGRNPLEIPLWEIKQWWAEAMTYYRAGESIELPLGVQIEAKRAQEEARDIPDWEIALEEYIDADAPKHWHRLDATERFSFLRGDGDVTEGVKRAKISPSVFLSEVMRIDMKDRQSFVNKELLRQIKHKLNNDNRFEKDSTTYRDATYGTQRGYSRKPQS